MFHIGSRSISDLTEESFPAEVREKKAIYYQGTDVQGFKICEFESELLDQYASIDLVSPFPQYALCTFP